VTTKMTGLLLSCSCAALFCALLVRGSEIGHENDFPNVQLDKANQIVQPSPQSVRTQDGLVEGTKKVNGIDLFYKAFGVGEPIVILHGGPSLEHSYLLPQFERLAAHHRLIFYDQRASGRSGGTTDEANINIPTFVADLDGIRESFGIQKMNLFGYSWGGLLAMSYAVSHPDKLQRLILVDSEASNTQDDNGFETVLQSRTPPAEKAELDQLRNSAKFQQGDVPTFRTWLRLRFRAYFFDPEQRNALNLDGLSPQTAKNFLKINEIFDKTFFTPGYDLTKQLPVIKCPTLIVHGDFDPIEPKYMKKVSCLIEGSDFWQLADCGHFSYIEHNEELFKLVEKFLAK
jgi:proline iminopeptidase